MIYAEVYVGCCIEMAEVRFFKFMAFSLDTLVTIYRKESNLLRSVKIRSKLVKKHQNAHLLQYLTDFALFCKL